jgi:hypothetical protein
MTIKEAIIQMINYNFQFVAMKREENAILEVLNSNAKHSNMLMLPHVSSVKLSRIDDNRDNLTIVYDDISIDCIVSWGKSCKNNFVVLKSLLLY